jgi:hypothetical protein
MAVPITGAAGTTDTIQAVGASIDPVQSLGGVYLDGGTLSDSPSITTRLSPGASVGDGMHGVQENESATGAFHTKKAHSAGVFSYGSAGKYIMIGGGSGQGTIGGVANTALDSSSAPTGGRRSVHFKVAQYGAKTLTAHAAGYWKATGVVNQRHNWSSYPTALTESYPTLGATNLGFSATVDSAARPSKAIPGHLTNLEDFTNWSHSDDAAHGGEKSQNYIQYEAKN